MNEKQNIRKRSTNGNRIPGMAYAPVDNGITLPVLDITCDRFVEGIDPARMEALKKGSTVQAEYMRRMPESQKLAVAQQSLIFGNRFNRATGGRFLSGISTYILKLGPDLIGDSDDWVIDRGISRGMASMAARMRLRDICRFQADQLKPLLLGNPTQKLRLINVAGGAASDSINTLILLHRDDPRLLSDRQVQIHLLDIDRLGPIFAMRCVEELKKPHHVFANLDVTVIHDFFDWGASQKRLDLFRNQEDAIVSCTSEGGLFEYGSDDDIRSNLEILNRFTPPETCIIGDVFHDCHTVDPTLVAMAETSGAAMRFLGLAGLGQILKNTRWELAEYDSENPVYIIFVLKKSESPQ